MVNFKLCFYFKCIASFSYVVCVRVFFDMQVGDGVMVYLLKYASIFLPLPRKKHYQVAGFPISDFCLKSKHISEPKCLHSSFAVGMHQLEQIHFAKFKSYVSSSSYVLLLQ